MLHRRGRTIRDANGEFRVMRRMLLAAAAVLGAGLGLGVMAGDAQA